MIKFLGDFNESTVVKVIGVGGAGGNAVNRMIDSDIRGVEFITTNTDVQALNTSQALTKIQIGSRLTRGQGAGANPEVGRAAAIEDRETLRSALEGANMVFITCGLGGGTGTGASPIIAEICKELNILTVAVVTKPFVFEGRVREDQAKAGLQELCRWVNTTITIPNQRLLSVLPKETPMDVAYAYAFEILTQAVRGISDLITIPGYINVDFADVCTVMRERGGTAIMGMGRAQGENRAVSAARQAVSSPLLEDVSIEGARGILINVTSGRDITISEVDDAVQFVTSKAHDKATIIFGSAFREGCDEIIVTVVANGFEEGAVLDELGTTDREFKMPEPALTGANFIPVTEDPLPQLAGPGFIPPTKFDDFTTPTFIRRRGFAAAP
jgi:cell division protein FtsZ